MVLEITSLPLVPQNVFYAQMVIIVLTHKQATLLYAQQEHQHTLAFKRVAIFAIKGLFQRLAPDSVIGVLQDAHV